MATSTSPRRDPGARADAAPFRRALPGGALWGSMTLAENVGLPLEEFTDLSPKEIRQIAALKLALVGLKGFEDFYPSQISGGMQKRAGLARAMALDPEILFLRRAVVGPGSDKLAAARQPDSRLARQSRRDRRGGLARAGEHFRDRQQQRLSGRGVAHHDCERRPQRAAGAQRRSAGASLSDPRRGINAARRNDYGKKNQSDSGWNLRAGRDRAGGRQPSWPSAPAVSSRSSICSCCTSAATSTA